MKGIANDLEECTITPDMKKEERNGCACRYMYYPDVETQQYVRSLSKGPQPFRPVSVLCHQVTESGVAMVSNREFVSLRTASDVSLNGKRKFLITTASVEPELQFCKKVVRGVVKNFNQYEDNGDGTYQVRTFFFADPCGNIPAVLFNQTLENQV